MSWGPRGAASPHRTATSTFPPALLIIWQVGVFHRAGAQHASPAGAGWESCFAAARSSRLRAALMRNGSEILVERQIRGSPPPLRRLQTQTSLNVATSEQKRVASVVPADSGTGLASAQEAGAGSRRRGGAAAIKPPRSQWNKRRQSSRSNEIKRGGKKKSLSGLP